MLEILLLVFLCMKMGRLLRKKGWKPLFMQFLVVLVWFGAEAFGAFAYVMYVAITQGQEAAEAVGFAAYPWALLAAAAGQLCLFGIAWILPTRTPVASFAVSSEPESAAAPDVTSPPYKPIG